MPGLQMRGLQMPGLQMRGLQTHGLQVERIRNQRKLFGHAENQRAARPDSDADIPVSARHLPAQRPDQVEFTARTDPILDRGKQRANRDDGHGAQQQCRRGTDTDKSCGAYGAYHEERARPHDQGAADGEDEQRPPAAAGVG